MNSLIDELAPKGSGQPELASRSFDEPSDLSNTVRTSSGVLSDTEGRHLLPALTVRTPTPRRAPSGLSVGILLYLLSVGIVATATVGVFFGIGFFFLAQTTEAMNANATTREHGVGAEGRLLHSLSNASSNYRASASVPIKPHTSRSAATAVLPVVSAAPPAARPSPRGDVSASDAKDRSFGKPAADLEAAREISPRAAPLTVQEPLPAAGSSLVAADPEATREVSPKVAPSALQKAVAAPGSSVAAAGPEAARELSPRDAPLTPQEAAPAAGSSLAAADPEATREVSPKVAPSALQKAVAAPGSSVAAAGPEAARELSPKAAPSAAPITGSSGAAPEPEAAPRLTAIQIAELLARGDSFLHAGDVASARLFYERAADAGDWRAAIRMGATFDPAFLDRAGVRTVGDPIKAQSWYHHSLDLGAPRIDRQIESSKTK